MRLRLLEPGSERGAQAGIERHRLESALIGGAAQCIKIQPSRGKQAFAGIGGKPTLCRQARLGIHRARQIELRARPTVLYHAPAITGAGRSEEHTSDIQSLMRISYAVFCLKQQKQMY